ncbi:unnamed protein product [Schistosoma curassoni]|nr:unnamed protein product [Schistosoma curassoni]
MSSREKYVFYKDRQEWDDVNPIPQDDGGRNIVNIAYSEEFVDAHDYFRAALMKDERSERTFSLTSDILLFNPANYTAWEYRRRIIEEISPDLNGEMRFVGGLIEDYSKNYQEIDFVQRRISFAPNNESSWNYFYGLLMPIVRGKKHIHNSSCKLLVDQNSNIKQNIMSDLQIMQKFAEELVASDQIAGDCLAPLSFLVEVYADCLESYFTEKSGSTCETHSSLNAVGVTSDDSNNASSDPKEIFDRAVNLCERLAREVDRVRANYWQYRARQLMCFAKKVNLIPEITIP